LPLLCRLAAFLYRGQRLVTGDSGDLVLLQKPRLSSIVPSPLPANNKQNPGKSAQQ
jgi:hypothetical protein